MGFTILSLTVSRALSTLYLATVARRDVCYFSRVVGEIIYDGGSDR
jgi:hypothetical protein